MDPNVEEMWRAIGPAELLVRGSIDFVAELESRNVRSDAFDDSGELGTENQR